MTGLNIAEVVFDMEESGKIDRGKCYVPRKVSDQVWKNKIADRIPKSKYHFTYYRRLS